MGLRNEESGNLGSWLPPIQTDLLRWSLPAPGAGERREFCGLDSAQSRGAPSVAGGENQLGARVPRSAPRRGAFSSPPQPAKPAASSAASTSRTAKPWPATPGRISGSSASPSGASTVRPSRPSASGSAIGPKKPALTGATSKAGGPSRRNSVTLPTPGITTAAAALDGCRSAFRPAA